MLDSALRPPRPSTMLARMCSLLLILTLTMAAGASGAAVAPTPLQGLYVTAARLHAAVDLLAAGHADEAQSMAEKAAVTAEGVSAEAADLPALVTELQDAVRAGDAEAAAAAARRGDDVLAAAAAPHLASEAVTAALAELIRHAEHEAEEAIEEGRLEPLVFGRALAQQASALARSGELSEAATGAVDAFTASLGSDPVPDVPTATDLDLGAVEATAAAALATLGAAPADADTARYFETIRADLALATSAYAEGDLEAADEALIDAYLENFEFLEAPLGAVDHELMESLEHTLRDDLRAMVRDQVEPASFEAAVATALEALERAQAALE